MTRRDFNAQSFYRKLGLAGLRLYCQESQSLSEAFLSALLDEDKKEEEAIADCRAKLESADNPNREQDLANFSMINDLACEKGFAHMRHVCESFFLERLLTPEITAHSLALTLFLYHRTVFDNAYSTFCIDYLEGWQVYAGRGVSTYKNDLEAAREDFRREVLNDLKRIGFGQALHVDAYPEPNRLILDIKYAGQLIRQEDFDAQGKIQTRTIRKPLEVGLAHYPEENILKVKTPRGMDGLNEAIHQAFSLNYLEKPETLTNPNQRRWINLSEFKTRKNFPFNASGGIRTAKVTGVRLKPYQGSSTHFGIRDKCGVLDNLVHHNIKISQAVLEMVAIRFEFEGKGQGRFQTVEMTHKNRINTNNSQRDAIIEDCLKRWGVLNG